MVDMDDVLVQDTLIYHMEKYSGKKICLPERPSYYLQDLLDDKEGFFEYFKKVNMYDGAKVVENAKEVLFLLSLEYDIYICTTYVWKEMVEECGKVLKDKYDYLIRNFPFIKPDNIIFASDKSRISFDVKIDDKLDNLENAGVKLLFSAYHNTGLSNEVLKDAGAIRVDNWKDIYEVLLGKPFEG